MFNVSLSPHIHSDDTIKKRMYGVIIALIPALIVSFFYFGIGSLVVMSTSVIACVLFEWLITKYLLKQDNTIADGSAILTGLLFGFNLPSNLPIWIILVGALVAIGIGKMTFGGLGNNPFNPALVGRCFLLVSFPAEMTNWPVAGQLTKYIDAETAATPLYYMKEAIKQGDISFLERVPDAMHLILGAPQYSVGAGTIGEICSLAIIIGLIFMLFKRIITWHIPISILLTTAILSAVCHAINPVYCDPITTITTGGLMLGSVFMATDYVTSPMTHKGQLVYGIAIGCLTIAIRNWGAYPEGMSFAILIMNAFTPLINTYIKPKRFGKEAKK